MNAALAGVSEHVVEIAAAVAQNQQTLGALMVARGLRGADDRYAQMHGLLEILVSSLGAHGGPPEPPVHGTFRQYLFGYTKGDAAGKRVAAAELLAEAATLSRQFGADAQLAALRSPDRALSRTWGGEEPARFVEDLQQEAFRQSWALVATDRMTPHSDTVAGRVDYDLLHLDPLSHWNADRAFPQLIDSPMYLLGAKNLEIQRLPVGILPECAPSSGYPTL